MASRSAGCLWTDPSIVRYGLGRGGRAVGRTAAQVQVGAAVGVLDRVRVGVRHTSDDPQLGGCPDVVELVLSEALDLGA